MKTESEITKALRNASVRQLILEANRRVENRVAELERQIQVIKKDSELKIIALTAEIQSCVTEFKELCGNPKSDDGISVAKISNPHREAALIAIAKKTDGTINYQQAACILMDNGILPTCTSIIDGVKADAHRRRTINDLWSVLNRSTKFDRLGAGYFRLKPDVQLTASDNKLIDEMKTITAKISDTFREAGLKMPKSILVTEGRKNPRLSIVEYYELTPSLETPQH